eukprot:CAMPEP_0194133664 /NCGR_PEP_ID=MMETSP0152-20130528/3740_1 /TAXON_ID=1049557 /ORGANISM="Thalassiothrix antarctica, Strain L6-D1" /LENGTH=154 /DNA_ID=CAMNT_0038829007 /DNA_START=8 /DNA_END=472 /DNA_ORIENTATION=-
MMFLPSITRKPCVVLTALLLRSTSVRAFSARSNVVVVDVISPGNGPAVTKANRYSSMVTLYIEDAVAETKTPSGWSTRKEDGAAMDEPFAFQPGKNLIEGWSEGVLRMKEGERAWLHVPAAKGYGASPMGEKGGAFYIPANSDLLFDIEILGKE